MNRNIIYYILGTIIFIVLYSYSKIGVLFLCSGVGVGLLIKDWLVKILDDLKNNFYKTETQNRANRKMELEAELEKLKKGSD